MEHQVINNNKPHPFWIWAVIVFILLLFSIKVKANPDTTYVVKGVVINIIEENKMLNSYCSGFYDGFDDGYCYERYGCIPPVPPICPIRRINEDDTYKAGYNREFVIGRKKQQNN